MSDATAVRGTPPVIVVDRVVVVLLSVLLGVASVLLNRFGGLVGLAGTCEDGCSSTALSVGSALVYAGPATVLLLSVPVAVSRTLRERAAWWVPLAAAGAAAVLVITGYVLVLAA